MTATLEPVTAAPLSHRCLRGRQCASREKTPAGRDVGAGTEAPDSLCRSCERAAGRAIAELPALYVELELIIGEHSSGGEHVSGTRELPTPPRLDVLALQADIAATACAWAAPVAQRCAISWDLTALRRSRPGPRVHRAARILASHLDALLRLPVASVDAWVPGHGVLSIKRRGIDGALDLLALHKRGRHLVTGGAGDSRLPVPCPSCEAPALVRANGSDQVDCRACGAYWPESDYRRLCLILAEDFGASRPRRRRRTA